jgi:hypothetical protein
MSGSAAACAKAPRQVTRPLSNHAKQAQTNVSWDASDGKRDYWHNACLIAFGTARRERFHESSTPNHKNGKIEKSKEGTQGLACGKHRAAISRIEAAAATTPRGGSLEKGAMKLLREQITRPLYIATLAIAMVGWMFALYHGLEWALGA